MPYLTPDEYARRFPESETTRLTDESRTGLPDLDKLELAIADQEQIIDSYLVGRYSLPLAASHPILEGISASLTREALHRSRPTTAVTEQADRARSMLRDLAAGRASIPTSEGGTPPVENPAGNAVRSNDGRPRVFTSCALDDFTGFGAYRPGTVYDGPRGW